MGCGRDATARGSCRPRVWGGRGGDEGHRVLAQFLDFIASSNKRELHNTLDVLSSKPFIFFLESSRPVLLPGILQKQLSPVWALKNGRHMGCSVAQAERNAQSDPGRGWPAGKELFEVEFVCWCRAHRVARLWAQENEATASWPSGPLAHCSSWRKWIPPWRPRARSASS